ncbi:MAG: 3'(2'),5'-bisphosphate nucleotidase CysQ [Solirubrobacterales bacterium]
MPTPASLIAALEDVARQAGAIILDIYNSDFAVERKGDDSPVTEADRRAEAVILPRLAELTPAIPVVAEEEAAAGRIPQIGDTFWLVDPLDGTKEFVKRNGEFTVNIGLISGGVPVAGVVYAPVLDLMWSGADRTATKVGADGVRHPIACRPVPATGAVVLDSRSHRAPAELEEFVARLPGATVDFAGSSLKFCRVAEGSADFYPRFGPTCEWDVAAGHAVLAAAGGEVVTLDERPFPYGKAPRFLNPGFLARARR